MPSPTATLIIGHIPDQVAGQSFGVAGTYQLNQLTWQDALQFEDDGSSVANPIPAPPVPVVVSSWSFTHKGLPVGQHTVSVQDKLTGTTVVSNTFNVIGAPTLTITPPSAPLADGVPFILSGVLANYHTIPTLQITLNDFPFFPFPGPPQGTVTLTSFQVLLTEPAGSYTVTVTDGTVQSTVAFTVAGAAKQILPAGAPAPAQEGQHYVFVGSLVGYTAVPTLYYGWNNLNAPIIMTQGVTLTGWNTVIPVPTSQGTGLGGSIIGQNTLFVTDGSTTASIPVTIVAAPKIIHPLAPANTVAGVAFTFIGTLEGYTTIPALTYTLDGGAPQALLGVTTTNWSYSITIPAAGAHNITVSDGTLTSSPVAFNTAAVAQPVTTRNVWDNPGGDGTFWVAPIATTARIIQSGPLVTLLQNGIGHSVPTGVVNTGDFCVPWYQGGAGDPIVKVTNGTQTIFVHIPLGATVETPYNSSTDSTIGGTDKTLPGLVWSGSAAKITTPGQASDVVQASGSVITCGYGLQIDWGFGEIMMDAVTGQPGTNNSIGTIQEYELLNALADPNYFPQHMLAIAMDPAMVSRAGPLWPLKVIDTSLQNATGTVFPQGVTIAIPQNAVMPSGKTRGFQFLWKIFQQFGGFFYNVAQNGAVSFGCKSLSSTTAALATDIATSFSEIMGHMGYLDFGVPDAGGNYNSGQAGAQYSQATQKGMAPGGVSAFPDPPPLDLSPTNLVNALPSTVQAWYPGGYNKAFPNLIVGNNTGGGPGNNPGGSTVIPAYWNANDKSSSITLSNNNLTATAGGSTVPSSTPQGVRATIAIDPSKIVLWEVTFPTITQDTYSGLANANFNFAGGGGGGSDANAIVIYPSTGTGSQSPQTIWFNNNQLATASGQASLPGDTTTFIARGSNLYCSNAAIRKTSGVQWNNATGADPVANTGGISFLGLSGLYYPLFGSTEAAPSGVLNDGTQTLSAFAQAYIAANPSVVTLSGQTPVANTKTIATTPPVGAIQGTPFQLSGTLLGYTGAPNLTLAIDNGAAIAIPNTTPTSYTITVTISSSGSHTATVSDGTIQQQITFNVGTTGVVSGTRVVAPLTGPVTPGNWISIEQDFSSAGVRLNSGKKPYGQLLLPAQYNPNLLYPILMRLHPDGEGTAHYTGGDSNSVINDTVNAQYNTVLFRTQYPCIVFCPYADQTGPGDSGTVNFGGWSLSPTSSVGSASSSNGITGPNVFANLSWINYLQTGTIPTTDYFGAGIPQGGTKLSGDVNRTYLDGFSLGAIGVEYYMLVYNQVNGNPKTYTAGLAFAGVVEINGYNTGPTPANITALTAPPIWCVSGANDTTSVPAHWNDQVWRALAGNSNYPGYGTSATLCRAGTSNWHYWRVPGLGHGDQGPDGSYYHTNATLLNWLFSQITTAGSVTPTPALTGLGISNDTVAPSSAVGTTIGTLSPSASTGTLTGVTYTIV